MKAAPNLIPISLSGDLRRGGWLATARVAGDTDLTSRGQNWRIVAKSGAGSFDEEFREIFNGHVLSDPDYRFDRYTSQATVQAGTIDALLAGERIQDIGFTDQAVPANDHQINGLDFAGMINHALQHHCNVIYDATGAAGAPEGIVTETDIDTTNSTLIGRYNVSKNANMWRALQQIAEGEFYNIWVDRRNKIHYQPRPMFEPSQPNSKGQLTTSHLRGPVVVKFWNSKPGQRVGQVNITTIKDTSTIYKSKYPTVPADGKILPSQDGFWAASQANSDTLAERLYRWLTRAYTLTVAVDPGLVLFGDDGDGLDLGDRLTVNYDGAGEDADTGSGVSLEAAAQSMYVYGINISFDVFGKVAKAILTLEYDNS